MKAALALSLMLAVFAICTLQVHGNYGRYAGNVALQAEGPTNRGTTRTVISNNGQNNKNKGSSDVNNENKQKNSVTKNKLDNDQTSQLEKDKSYSKTPAEPPAPIIVLQKELPKAQYVPKGYDETGGY